MSERVTCPLELYKAFEHVGGLMGFRRSGVWFNFVIQRPIPLPDWSRANEPIDISKDRYHEYHAKLCWESGSPRYTYWVEVDGIRITHPWRDTQRPEAYLPHWG